MINACCMLLFHFHPKRQIYLPKSVITERQFQEYSKKIVYWGVFMFGKGEKGQWKGYVSCRIVL